MDLRLGLMTGIDLPIEGCQLIVHQPTIKDISYLGEERFFTGVQTICLYKSMFTSEDKGVLDDVTNFQIFMTIVKDKEMNDKKIAVEQLLEIIFPQYKVLFTPMSMIFQSENGIITVDQNNFEEMQKVLRMIFCAQTGPMDQQAFNPADAKAKEIAEKLMRGRQRVAAQKTSGQGSVLSQYISSLSIGAGFLISDLVNLTMYQLYDLIERYSLYTNWDIDLRIRLAGGKPDSQVEDWMKNIH